MTEKKKDDDDSGSGHHFELLPGEVLVDKVLHARHCCPFTDHHGGSGIPGALFLTNYKLVFENAPHSTTGITTTTATATTRGTTTTTTAAASSPSPSPAVAKKEKPLAWKGNRIPFSKLPGPEVPLGLIARIERIRSPSAGAANPAGGGGRKDSSLCLEITCHDFRTLRFLLPVDSNAGRAIYDSLVSHAFPLSFGLSPFALSNKETYPDNGWNVYDPVVEYKRQGVAELSASGWRFYYKNKDFSICPTYPAILVVPGDLTDETVDGCAKFRSSHRFPVLSWLHPSGNASITRCSQPKVGPWRRSEADEAMIKSIRRRNGSNAKLYIMDARPKVNAVANQAKGAGYENIGNYEDIELHFMGIENIHVMRNCLKSLRDICYPKIEDLHWFQDVEKTHWLDQIRLLLESATEIVKYVDQSSISVLVHCSDGWDRTSQLTALSMLMLDKEYRTIRGFAKLIEKEWLSFGHKFKDRIGYGDKNYGDEQRSPIFLQFLDCVYQLLYQFPCSFQFSEQLLLTIADELYTCRFGTFFYNCERERVANNLRTKTPSLWSYVLANEAVYENPQYIAEASSSAASSSKVLIPMSSMRRMRVWHSYYLRWQPSVQAEDQGRRRQVQMKDAIATLEKQILELRTQQPAPITTTN